MNSIRRVALCFVLGLLGTPVWGDTISLPLTDDAWINANSPSGNFGSVDDIFVHNWGPKYGLVRFDAASIAGQSVNSATLELYLSSIAANGSISVHAITSSWDETTVTWSNQPPVESAATAIVSVTTADAGATVVIDVTSAVQRWADGALPDAGFLIVTSDGIKALFDAKEKPAGIPASLIIETGAVVSDGRAIVLDFTDPDNCVVDASGYYILDRSWDFASKEQGVQCQQLVISTSLSEQIYFDLRGYRIVGANGVGAVAVDGVGQTGNITLRNGEVHGSIYGSDTSLRVENLSIYGSLETVNVWALVVEYSHISDGGIGFWIDHTSRCSSIEISSSSVSGCPDNLCIAMDSCDSTVVRGNRLAGAIRLNGRGVILDNLLTFSAQNGLAGIEVFYNTGATVARNTLDLQTSAGTGIRINDEGNKIIDNNIIRRAAVGIEFSSDATGNFFGNNRVSATSPYVGAESQIDWGGNVSF